MLARPGVAWLACLGVSLSPVSAGASRAADTCSPRAANLAPDAPLAGAHGRYRVVLVTRTGEKAVGVLVAAPPGREVLARARVDTAARGRWTSISAKAIRVQQTRMRPACSFSSSNAAAHARSLLRIGSEANRVDQRLYDGGYTVLRVQEIDADGFAGTWQSGVGSSVTTGHFCATRP